MGQQERRLFLEIGTGKRLDIRDSISNEQAFADDYKQESRGTTDEKRNTWRRRCDAVC